MYKKILAFLIFLLMFYIIISPTALSSDTHRNKKIKSIFAASPIIDLIYTPLNESIIPNAGVHAIPLETSLTLTGFFSNLQYTLNKNKKVLIELSIIEKNDWCYASLENHHFSISPANNNPIISILKIAVNERAPAFTQGKVKIKATSSEIRGIFFRRIIEGEREFDVTFTVGYIPIINYDIENNFYKVPANLDTEVPVKIKNLGNGATTVDIEIQLKPKNWNVTYPKNVVISSPIEGKNSEAEVIFSVRPPTFFDRETVKIKFTPNYVGRFDLKGMPEVITFTFENKVNNIENQGYISNFTSPVLFSLLIMGLVLFLIYRAKYKK